jgi:hypothetical protein
MAKGPGAEVEHTELVSKRDCPLLETRPYPSPAWGFVDSCHKGSPGVDSLVKCGLLSQLLAYQSTSSK